MKNKTEVAQAIPVQEQPPKIVIQLNGKVLAEIIAHQDL